jgi:hypothetical protein
VRTAIIKKIISNDGEVADKKEPSHTIDRNGT